MSVRTGYSLSYDFVNAQFHLNTSVAPPFNAEARVDNPAGGFDNPWLGTGNETFFPFTTGPNSVFPLTGPYISIPSDIRVPRQQSWNVSLQRQVGENLAVSATYLGSYSDRLWNVRSLNPGVYIPGACTLQTPTGPQNFNPCSTTATLNFRRVLTMQDYPNGKYPGRRGRAHRARLPEVQRAAAQRAAPHGEPLHRQCQLHAVEVHGAAHPGRHHAQRRYRLREPSRIPPTTTVRATPTAATCST